MDKEVDVNQTATPKKKRGGARYPKGVMPPQFVGKGFDAHPENINKDGGAIRSINALRKRAQEIGNELVEFEFGKGKNKVKMKMTRTDRILLDWHVSQEYSKQKSAIEYSYGKVPEKLEVEDDKSSVLTALPADVIAPDFLNAYRDIKNKKHTEYLFYGGRGSTKSSFVSLVIPWLLINNPTMHALATRQVANTLRDSVFSQIQWAIGELGLSDSFKCTVSPMEIQYIPTGQTIYFRGADDPNKIKSIKPPFGYIGILWFEELDQFYGQESIRKIEQSVIRGGDEAFIFKSFNPSKTSGNWANKYVQIPKVTQYQHKSSYLTVPTEWLGKTFLEEAEHLKNVNLSAYEHEYLGIVNGMGGQVFGNVVIRAITDEEIYGAKDSTGMIVGGFDRVLHGLDWGFYPDPAHYVKCHYDAARMTLYIYGEVRRWKTGNEDLHKILKEYGLTDSDQIIADSAEPKSVADFRAYGATCRGAEKGPESVNYSMKWLQSLRSIVIDNVRAPYAADEFMDYAFEETKDGEIINSYPDSNNHAIDAVRYATNMIWKQRGR